MTTKGNVVADEVTVPPGFLTPKETDTALLRRRGPTAVSTQSYSPDTAKAVMAAEEAAPNYQMGTPSRRVIVVQPDPDLPGQMTTSGSWNPEQATINTELVRSVNDPIGRQALHRFATRALTVEELSHRFQCKAGQLPLDAPPPPWEEQLSVQRAMSRRDIARPEAKVSKAATSPTRAVPGEAKMAQAASAASHPSRVIRVPELPPTPPSPPPLPALRVTAPSVPPVPSVLPVATESLITEPPRPLVAEPEVDVIFSLELGTIMARYHHVVVTPAAVVCIYDTRWRFGTQFSPPDNRAFEVAAPKLGLQARVHTCGLRFGFSFYDIEVLFRPPAVEGDEATPLSGLSPGPESPLYSPHDLTEEDAELLAEYFGGAEVTTNSEDVSGETISGGNRLAQPGVDLFGD